MAFNFPNSPNVGDIYVVGSTTFQFNGIAWDYANTTAVLAFAQANAAYAKANAAAQVTFGTIIANGNTIVASSTNDTVTLLSSSNVSIVGNTSTKNITFDITTTGVTATTYGSSTIVPVFVVDSRGRLTSVTNTTIDTSIATAAFTKANQQTNLAFTTVVANGTSLVADSNADTLTIRTTGNVAITADATGDNMTFDLTTTGVTATTYGSSTVVPTFVVDTRGRLTSATNVSIDLSSTVLKTGNTMTGNLVMSGANIAFSTATNTGLYWSGTAFVHSPAANTLIFGTSSTEDLRIDSGGNLNVAIGLYVTGIVSDAKANVLSQSLTDGATISWDASLGRIANVILGGARVISNATNIRVGTYILRVQQNTTSGNSTLTFGRQYKFTANVAPTLTASANAVDLFSFVSDGTNMYGAMIPDVRS